MQFRLRRLEELLQTIVERQDNDYMYLSEWLQEIELKYESSKRHIDRDKFKDYKESASDVTKL